MTVSLYNALAGGLDDQKIYDAQDPIYSSGAALLNSPLPVARTNTEALLGPLIQGLVGGTMAGYGQESAKQAAYNDYSRINNAINIGTSDPVALQAALSADPTNTPTPKDWTVKQGQALLAQSTIQQQMVDDIKSKVTTDALTESVKNGTYTPAQAIKFASGSSADLQAALASDGTNPRLQSTMDSLHIPEGDRAGIKTPEELQLYMAHVFGQDDKQSAKSALLEDKAKKEWDTKNGKILDTLIPIKSSLDDLGKLNSPPSDLALQELLQRSITPGAQAVRAEFFNKITDAQNPANKLAGTVNKWLGGGSLDDASRKQIGDTIKSIVDDKLNYYKTQADNIKGIADRRKLDFSNIIPDYNTAFGSIKPKNTTGVLDSIPAGYAPNGKVDANGNQLVSRIG